MLTAGGQIFGVQPREIPAVEGHHRSPLRDREAQLLLVARGAVVGLGSREHIEASATESLGDAAVHILIEVEAGARHGQPTMSAPGGAESASRRSASISFLWSR